MRDYTTSQADDLYELVTERTRGALILASNRKPADWYPLFPNPVVAESILDRLVNAAHAIANAGRSNPAVLARNGGPWRGLDDLEIASCGWVSWFNDERIHGELDDQTPAEVEDEYRHRSQPEAA